MPLAAVWLLTVYFVIVLPVERAFPAIDNWKVAMLLLVVSVPACWWVTMRVLLRGPNAEGRGMNFTLLSATVLVAMLAADIGSTMYRTVVRSKRPKWNAFIGERSRDPRVWDGELMPVEWTEPGSVVARYKPGQTRSATVHGEHYYQSLLQIPVLRDSVLEQQRVSFVIDEYGLRNTHPPDSASIFMLGDSFAFGYHTTQDATVSELMTEELGEPVYNLGVSGTSTVTQALLLEKMLETYPESFKPERILWMVYEGNDLEEAGPAPEGRSPGRIRQLLEGTILSSIVRIPDVLRQQSIIRFASRGTVEAEVRAPAEQQRHYEVDGKRIAIPLYHSPRLGYRLFRQGYIDVATQPESYVQHHPNWPNIVYGFERMRSLADAHNFAVTVVLVPSDVRVYADKFDDFPAISEAPYFLQHVGQLANRMSFDTLNLLPEMLTHADTSLLYFRDDTHWNPLGQRVAADMLVRYLNAQHASAK